MLTIELLGYAAGTLTTIAIIPEIIDVHKTKDVKDISLLWLVIVLVGLALWLVYGYFIASWPLIIANAVSLALYLLMMGLTLKYK